MVDEGRDADASATFTPESLAARGFGPDQELTPEAGAMQDEPCRGAEHDGNDQRDRKPNTLVASQGAECVRQIAARRTTGQEEAGSPHEQHPERRNDGWHLPERDDEPIDGTGCKTDNKAQRDGRIDEFRVAVRSRAQIRIRNVINDLTERSNPPETMTNS